MKVLGVSNVTNEKQPSTPTLLILNYRQGVQLDLEKSNACILNMADLCLFYKKFYAHIFGSINLIKMRCTNKGFYVYLRKLYRN